MNKKIVALPVTVLLAIGLSACDGGGSQSGVEAASDQTVAEACEILAGSMDAVKEKVTDLTLSADPTDEEAAKDLVSTMQAELRDAAAGVTNTEVKNAWDGLIGAFDALADIAADQAADSNAAMTLLDDMATASNKLSEVCPDVDMS